MTAKAVKKFKTDESLGSTQYPDVGRGTMRRPYDLFNGAAPNPPQTVLEPGARAGWAQLNEAVDTYSDPANQKEIDAIVKLAGVKLDGLLADLAADGYTRLKKK